MKGGGHAMAAGITVEREKLGALRAFFEEIASEDVFRLREEETLKVDAALLAEGANLQLLEIIEKAGPFGAGHAQPVFVLPRHEIARVQPVGTGHLRVDLKSGGGGRIQAMAFRCAETDLGNFLLKSQGRTVHVAGSISANYWNGAKSVQFRLTDAALAG